MAQLAIKGHATRGKEVIEILEMLGGKNDIKYSGGCTEYEYIINEQGIIDWKPLSFYSPTVNIIFALEEFLELYPFKVGDKVLINKKVNDVYTVKSMEWQKFFDRVIYKIEALDGIMDNHIWFAHEMVLFNRKKEETMEEKGTLEQIDLTSELLIADEVEVILGDYEFVLKDGKTYFVKKNKYPKTYEECCKMLGYNQVMPKDHILGYKGSLLSSFQQLLICRDAYWKLAGEQMGLGKPWEPDWSIYKHKFCLGTDKDKVIEECVTTGNRILTFPTAEMRDAFFENFKDLIESCKEIL